MGGGYLYVEKIIAMNFGTRLTHENSVKILRHQINDVKLLW